ncbi:MAG: long-chain fatty acid--CoA ligase [Candidatus Sedimenticola sp. (ex Thyasira tokunagai)]
MLQQQEEITLEEARTIPGLFRARIRKTPDLLAYRYYDNKSSQWLDSTWAEMGQETARWQQALINEGLVAGDRVGLMMPNCREWVMLDQATLGLGMINVPLFYNDRGGNVAYIAEASNIKLLVITGEEQWKSLEPVREALSTVHRIITLNSVAGLPHDDRLRLKREWLPPAEDEFQVREGIDPDEMATIVYTSGTTGNPKGVMLSHSNILSNTYASIETTSCKHDDTMLSFLPLSHMLERTAGYYLPMLGGAPVAFARSIQQLGEDLISIRPTLLISVPRVYERVYAKIQDGLEQKPAIAGTLFNLTVKVGWKRYLYSQHQGGWSPWLILWPLLHKLVAGKVLEKLGGRLRTAISGGAPLPPEVAHTFLALGVPLLQGYGLTETSPVLAVNRLGENIPESVGKAITGTELMVGDGGELLARGSAVMLGFWNNPEETARVIDREGWFHTGDIARIDEQGYVYITGRIKDIIVLANGEKVSPADMEIAIAMDALFEQVMVIGEGRPFLSVLVVPEAEHWKNLAEGLGLDPENPTSYQNSSVLKLLKKRIGQQLHNFPGYAQIRQLAILNESWTVENGLLTPTLKTKRSKILEKYETTVESLYSGH